MRVLICDDEIEMLDKCKARIKEISIEENKVVEILSYSSGEWMLEDREEWINSVSLMYLDIEIGKINGIELAKKIRGFGFNGEIVFLTVSKEYVFDSFDVSPLNYILKDEMNSKKFKEVYLKGVSIFEEENKKNFSFKLGKGQMVIPLKDIVFFEANKKIITVNYKEQKEASFYSNMDEVLEKTSEGNFIRIHKSYIVNIEEIHTFKTKEIKLNTGEVIPIGRKYKDEAKEAFFTYVEGASFEI